MRELRCINCLEILGVRGLHSDCGFYHGAFAEFEIGRILFGIYVVYLSLDRESFAYYNVVDEFRDVLWKKDSCLGYRFKYEQTRV
jgi:hypothetical protein